LIKEQSSSGETSNAQDFLDDDLEDCINALHQSHAQEEQEACYAKEEFN
jgi:hypothetical protein